MDFKKDYSAFNAEDFAADELFRAWVLGNNAQIQAYWRYWLLENPHKKEIVGDAQNILKAVQESQPPVSEIEVNEGVEQILAQIKKVNSPKPMRIIHKRKFFLIGLAATLTLLITSSLWFFYQKKGADTEGGVWVQTVKTIPILLEASNPQRQPLAVTLSDGSVVTLERGSRLTYPSVFDADKREVTLIGEAFFEITKNPSKPFLVHAQGVMTKVLGTSFRIKAFDKNVKVLVNTGKVAVFTQNDEKETESEKQAIVLTPNQEVEYKSETNRFSKAIQAQPTLLTTPTKMKELYFNDTPIPIVFNALAEAYGIEIIYDEETLHNCIITTSLTDEPLFEKLTIICKTIGASYREIDAKIIVTGRGCK